MRVSTAEQNPALNAKRRYVREELRSVQASTFSKRRYIARAMQHTNDDHRVRSRLIVESATPNRHGDDPLPTGARSAATRSLMLRRG